MGTFAIPDAAWVSLRDAARMVCILVAAKDTTEQFRVIGRIAEGLQTGRITDIDRTPRDRWCDWVDNRKLHFLNNKVATDTGDFHPMLNQRQVLDYFRTSGVGEDATA